LALSEKTKTAISGANVVEEQICDFAFDPGATPVYRLSDEVPKTSDDMTNLFMWQHGDKVKGTHAKDHEGMKEYINDINKAFGKEAKYEENVIYIDTLSPRKSVSEQLEELK